MCHSCGDVTCLSGVLRAEKIRTKSQTLGLPVVVQRKQTRLVSLRTWVQSLALLSGLRIRCCCELCYRSQVRLRSGAALKGQRTKIPILCAFLLPPPIHCWSIFLQTEFSETLPKPFPLFEKLRRLRRSSSILHPSCTFLPLVYTYLHRVAELTGHPRHV